jgi:hypothetical protein
VQIVGARTSSAFASSSESLLFSFYLLPSYVPQAKHRTKEILNDLRRTATLDNAAL